MAVTQLVLLMSLAYITHSSLLHDQPSCLSMETQFTWVNDVAVFDKDRKPFAVMNITLVVYGDKHPNQTYFKTLITDKLAHIQHYSVEPAGHNVPLHRGLPLKFNETVFEVIATGPKPVNKMGVSLQVLLYSDKTHHDQVVSLIKSMG